MHLVISPTGVVRTIYGEQLDLKTLGSLHIERASRVEPDENGEWRADLSPVSGPLLGPYRLRSEALAAEHAWLEAHWLVPRVLILAAQAPDTTY